MEEIVYFNGSFIPFKEAKIPVLDYGFLFGYGLFETMRAYNGTVFQLDSHLSRLEDSAKRLGIPIGIPALKNAVTDTIRINDLKQARVRLTVSPGEGSPAPDPRTCTKPTILVVATKYTPYTPAIYEKGFRAIISSIRRNSQSPVPGMKTANYLESLLSRQEAIAAGVDDTLLLNEKGLLAEASSSNVFIVSNNSVVTPRVGSGILPGITRKIVLELGFELGISSMESDIRLADLLAAGEAFLTNSMIEIMPLVEVNGQPIGPGKPGAITRQLMSAYKHKVN